MCEFVKKCPFPGCKNKLNFKKLLSLEAIPCIFDSILYFYFSFSSNSFTLYQISNLLCPLCQHSSFLSFSLTGKKPWNHRGNVTRRHLFLRVLPLWERHKGELADGELFEIKCYPRTRFWIGFGFGGRLSYKSPTQDVLIYLYWKWKLLSFS